ncbi:MULTISPECIES: hypothetical protein [unclassified Streptomyces]|uniref:hypothetical protein n=1 Tax=unclassified Streptomyces TaxID=2593676 RepID=UPI001F542001|nr:MULTISPECIES: hypothetical protein [unclassified Streptomyces]
MAISRSIMPEPRRPGGTWKMDRGTAQNCVGSSGSPSEGRGGAPRTLVGEMRHSVLLVPIAADGLWSARLSAVRWICGFTDETTLAWFARQHDPSDQPVQYAAVLGARIVDEIVPP